MKTNYILIITTLIALFGCKSYTDPPATVEKVDLEKYAGKWYEIGSFPASFQKNCTCTSAEYTIEEKYVRVVNRCYNTKKEKWTKANAKAWSAEGSGNSKLKVQFFWPFKGDYWILYIDDSYQTALVGSPDRNYMWILHRDKTMDQDSMDKLLDIAQDKGYNVSRFNMTAQDCT